MYLAMGSTSTFGCRYRPAKNGVTYIGDTDAGGSKDGHVSLSLRSASLP